MMREAAVIVPDSLCPRRVHGRGSGRITPVDEGGDQGYARTNSAAAPGRFYEPVPYDAAGLIDPFRPAKMMADSKQSGGGGLQPDLNRLKEPLESYPLESISYVGSLTKKHQTYGIVSVDGALHQVRAGSYMGQNFGNYHQDYRDGNEFARAGTGSDRRLG